MNLFPQPIFMEIKYEKKIIPTMGLFFIRLQTTALINSIAIEFNRTISNFNTQKVSC